MERAGPYLRKFAVFVFRPAVAQADLWVSTISATVSLLTPSDKTNGFWQGAQALFWAVFIVVVFRALRAPAVLARRERALSLKRSHSDESGVAKISVENRSDQIAMQCSLRVINVAPHAFSGPLALNGSFDLPSKQKHLIPIAHLFGNARIRVATPTGGYYSESLDTLDGEIEHVLTVEARYAGGKPSITRWRVWKDHDGLNCISDQGR